MSSINPVGGCSEMTVLVIIIIIINQVLRIIQIAVKSDVKIRRTYVSLR